MAGELGEKQKEIGVLEARQMLLVDEVKYVLRYLHWFEQGTVKSSFDKSLNGVGFEEKGEEVDSEHENLFFFFFDDDFQLEGAGSYGPSLEELTVFVC